MRRRDFIAGISGVAVISPLTARAEQSAIPIVGFLNGGLSASYAGLVAAFEKGLGEAGYTNGRNVAIEYRWAEGHNERLPELAAQLVRLEVAAIAATSTPAALAAKTVNTAIPIIFETAADPVELGLVASLNKLGGNITGVALMSVEVASKRLEILHELFPERRAVALLVNPSNPVIAETSANEMRAAARTYDIALHVLEANADAALVLHSPRPLDCRLAGL